MPRYDNRFRNPSELMATTEARIRTFNSNVVKWGLSTVWTAARKSLHAQTWGVHLPLYDTPNLNNEVCSCSLRLEGQTVEDAIGHLNASGEVTLVFVWQVDVLRALAVCQQCGARKKWRRRELTDDPTQALAGLDHDAGCHQAAN